MLFTEESEEGVKIFTAQQKELAITRAKMYGVRRAAIQTGIPVETIREWVGETTPAEKEKQMAGRKTYTDEQKAEALKRVGEIGLRKAAKELGISTGSLMKWRADASLGKAADQGAAAEIEAKKNTRAAVRKAKKAIEDTAAIVSEQAAVSAVEVRKTAAKAGRKVKQKAADTAAKIEDSLTVNIVIQSQDGKAVTAKEIIGMVPANTESVYVKAEEGRLYWVGRDGSSGSVDLW